MSLTHKITSLLLAVFGFFFAAQFVIHHKVLRPSFDMLEQAEAKTDMDRSRDAISQELAHLSTLCNDWACWDDSYQFVQDRNQDFIDDTLTGDVLDVANLTLLMYCDTAGRIVWREATSSSITAEDIWTGFPEVAFEPDHFLIQHGDMNEGVTGVMLVHGYPLLVASRAVLTSSAEGPRTGSLIMARLLDDDLNDQLGKQTHVNFTALRPELLDAFAGVDEAAMLEGEQIMRIRDSSMLEVFTSLPYLNTDSSLILVAEVPRRISQEAQASLTFAMLTFGATSLAALLALVIALRVLVLEPLGVLRDHATSTASTGDWAARLNTSRVDEFGTLANELDNMVAALAAYHTAANAMAHDAGRAELVSGAVHDIGNAINSAGVCAHMLSDLARRSAIPKLQNVSALLHEMADAPTATDADPTRLDTLSVYTSELADLLLQERDDSMQELEALVSHIQRVIQVTQTQMSVVNSSVQTAATSLTELADMAIAVSRPSFAGEGLEVTTTICKCESIWIDRSKVLQVLTALLSLAAESVASNDVGEQYVGLSATLIGNELVRIEVADNGKGHRANELATLFAQRQTATDRLDGFDLHHCSIAANAIGGTLIASSDGPGQGTTFTFDFPLVRLRSTQLMSEGTGA